MLYTARTCSVISSAHACKCVHRICPDTRHSVQRTLSTDRSRFLSQDDRSIDDSYSTYGYQGRTVFGVSNGNPHVHVRRRQIAIYVQSVNACLMPCLIRLECDHIHYKDTGFPPCHLNHIHYTPTKMLDYRDARSCTTTNGRTPSPGAPNEQAQMVNPSNLKATLSTGVISNIHSLL
jgi:hypothetical protein